MTQEELEGLKNRERIELEHGKAWEDFCAQDDAAECEVHEYRLRMARIESATEIVKALGHPAQHFTPMAHMGQVQQPIPRAKEIVDLVNAAAAFLVKEFQG